MQQNYRLRTDSSLDVGGDLSTINLYHNLRHYFVVKSQVLFSSQRRFITYAMYHYRETIVSN